MILRLFFTVGLYFCSFAYVHAEEQEPYMLNEPDLSSYSHVSDGTYKAFRFILSRSLEDEDLIYIVILNNGLEQPSVTIRRFSKASGKYTKTERKSLSKTQIKNLARFEMASNFWSLPTHAGKTGFDGNTWTIEGLDGKNRHLTSRWSPMPPYYAGKMDIKTKKIVRVTSGSPENEGKSSDEVGLDVFSLLFIFLDPNFDEMIY